MNDWVSVKDSLPPYGQIVAIASKFVNCTDTVIGFGRRTCTDIRGEHWEGEYDPIRDSRQVNFVTHWMALGEPPK